MSSAQVAVGDTEPAKKPDENKELIVDENDVGVSSNAEQSPLKAGNKKITKRILDSDNEEEVETANAAVKTGEQRDKKVTKSMIVDSDEDEPVEGMNNISLAANESAMEDNFDVVKSQKPKKISALIDSESEEDSEAEQNVSGGEQSENVPAERASIKGEKPMRASAKRALDEMQAIQSEQQRLHREAQISVPYHVPKKYTLQEFLKRRTISKPLPGGDANASAAVVQGLKMSPEELESYAKLMDERAKEATEFFRSESEDDEIEIANDNDKEKEFTATTMEEVTPTDETKEINQTEMAIVTSTEKVSKDWPLVVEEQQVVAQSIDAGQPAAVEELELPTCSSRVVITEVLELPTLDLRNANITPDKSRTAKSSTNAVQRLIDECKLADSPSLQGSPNMLIDLDTGDLVMKPLTGVDNLLQRLLATKARKPKTGETCSILSTENGKLEMSTVNVHSGDTDTEANVEQKPGAAFFKVQENLKGIIQRKRLEQMQKKRKAQDEAAGEEFEPNTKPGEREADADDCIQYDDDEECIADDVECIADDEECIADEDEAILKNGTDDEAVTDGELESEDNVSIKQDVEIIEKEPRKSRIITAFQDDSDDGMDMLQTQLTQSPIGVAGASLFDPETQRNPSDGESELLALCSGNFDASQAADASAAIISQMPITQPVSLDKQTAELLKLCSGTFDAATSQTQPPAEAADDTDVPTKCNKILSSDEENAAIVTTAESAQKRAKKLTKRQKKKTAKLCFSDEDDDDTQEGVAERRVAAPTDDMADVNDEPETYVDYDSEENEIVVKMSKSERVAAANKYVEYEAELSESEWGSADEDEKNMDRYDIELGDEDDFDGEKLRDELGRIHARKMLDEDIREMRKLQEIFFEDEETDGKGRERQFRWKNAETGFSLDVSKPGDNDNNNGGESGDEENEQLWRQIRYEREQILREQNGGDGSSTAAGSASVSNVANGVATTTADGTHIRKLNIITARKSTATAMEVKRATPFLISQRTTPAIATMQKKVRGSFLVRDKTTLMKLAGALGGGPAGMGSAETTGTVSVKTIKAKNFVFATLTEAEHESLKRKAGDLMNSSNENGVDYMKRPKLEPRRSKCLIDQLL